MNDLVILKDNKAVTTSLKIAEVFKKRHDAVLRDIKNLECSENFNLHNFVEITYIDQRNRKQRMYEVTKDGFMFLAMGFTGKEAGKWKELFISKFNEMAKMLSGYTIQTELEEMNRRIKRIKNQVQYELFPYEPAQINTYKGKKAIISLKLDPEIKNKFKAKCSLSNYSMRGYLRKVIKEIAEA